MATRRRAVVMVVFLAAAGCAGGGLAPVEPSVTPAPLPTDAPPTPAFRLAPGLSEAGVVSPAALIRAHVDRLRSAPFHVRVVERVERLDGTLLETSVVEGTFADPYDYRLRIERHRHDGSVIVRSQYATGTRLFERLTIDDDVRYYVPREGLDPRMPYPEKYMGNPMQRDQLYAALQGSRPAYAGIEPDGDRSLYRIASSEPSHVNLIAAWEYVDTVESFEFTALVGSDGAIRESEVRFVARNRDARFRVVRTARWSEIGTATVEPPAWYATARDRTRR